MVGGCSGAVVSDMEFGKHFTWTEVFDKHFTQKYSLNHVFFPPKNLLSKEKQKK